MAVRKRGPPTVPVTMRALVQRVNRKRAPEGRALKAARSERARQELGDFYEVDLTINGVTAQFVDPEQLARELDILQPWERVEE